MHTGDVLLLPKCDVAEEATYCWHDVIKNKIQTLGDQFLELWLDDAANVDRLQAVLESVLANLDGFSPARAAGKLAPIIRMPETARSSLLTRLDEAFRLQFDLVNTRERLRAVVDPLTQALRECRSAQDGSGRPERLLTLRTAAAAVRRELEALPAGFCIPVHVR